MAAIIQPMAFMTKILNEDNLATPGAYTYSNVKRWSKRDIFQLNKIFFPINKGKSHWLCAMVDIPAKKIQVYDSLSKEAFCVNAST